MSRFSSIRGKTLAISLFVCVVALPAPAQTVFSGVVLGPDDLPVEGVTIYLTNIETGAQLDFTTLASGAFEFSGLSSGEYRVTSTTTRLGTFTVTLTADEPVRRELKIPFGPFTSDWLVLPPAALDRRISSEQPPGFRCSTRMIVNVSGVWQPFCNLSFMIDEFEANEQQRVELERAGGGAAFIAPRLVGAPNQSYPAALLDTRAEGVVTVETRIGPDGSQTRLRVVSSSNPALNDAALASVASARWESARVRGRAVEMPVNVTVTFRLETLQAPPGRPLQSIAAQVVRVTPTEETTRRMVFFKPSGPYRITNYTVRELIRFAYSLDDAHIVGLPEWAMTERFDIEQSFDTEPTAAEVQALVRDMLAIQFRLTTHVEQRDFPAYLLRRVGPQPGPGLRRSEADCTQRPPVTLGVTACSLRLDERGIYGIGLTMAQLASQMSGSGYIQLQRPVIDQTGLEGRYDMEISLIRMQRDAAANAGGVRIASIRSNEPLTVLIEREWGLRLEDGSAPNDVMVVDRVERPAR